MYRAGCTGGRRRLEPWCRPAIWAPKDRHRCDGETGKAPSDLTDTAHCQSPFVSRLWSCSFPMRQAACTSDGHQMNNPVVPPRGSLCFRSPRCPAADRSITHVCVTIHGRALDRRTCELICPVQRRWSACYLTAIGILQVVMSCTAPAPPLTTILSADALLFLAATLASYFASRAEQLSCTGWNGFAGQGASWR